MVTVLLQPPHAFFWLLWFPFAGPRFSLWAGLIPQSMAGLNLREHAGRMLGSNGNSCVRGVGLIPEEKRPGLRAEYPTRLAPSLRMEWTYVTPRSPAVPAKAWHVVTFNFSSDCGNFLLVSVKLLILLKFSQHFKYGQSYLCFLNFLDRFTYALY